MTILLLLHLQPISYLAGVASETSLSNTNQAVLVIDLIKKAGAAIIVLLATTTLSICKPWGKIRYRQHAREQQKKPASFYLLVGLISLIILFIIIHLVGGGLGRH